MVSLIWMGLFNNMIVTIGLILIVYGLMARRKYKYILVIHKKRQFPLDILKSEIG